MIGCRTIIISDGYNEWLYFTVMKIAWQNMMTSRVDFSQSLILIKQFIDFNYKS